MLQSKEFQAEATCSLRASFIGEDRCGSFWIRLETVGKLWEPTVADLTFETLP